MDSIAYGYAIHLLRAIAAGVDPDTLIAALTRQHASVSADPPNGTKERVANACCNKFDECSPEPEYVSARFILFADRPDVDAEPEAPAVPLLFKDWVAPPTGIAFFRAPTFPFVGWGKVIGTGIPDERRFVHVETECAGIKVKPLAVLPEKKAQALIERIKDMVERRAEVRKVHDDAWEQQIKSVLGNEGINL